MPYSDPDRARDYQREYRKRTAEPVLVSVVTFGTRFSFPVSWRSYPCPKANPVIPTRNSIGDT